MDDAHLIKPRLSLLLVVALLVGVCQPLRAEPLRAEPLQAEPRQAEPLTVVIPTESSPALEPIREALKKNLTEHGWLPVFVPSDDLANRATDTPWVTLGPQSLREALFARDKATPHPVISLYVDRSRFEALRAADPLGMRQVTALYPDPPLERQIHLARALTPGGGTIGVLLQSPVAEIPSTPDTLLFYRDAYDSLAHYLSDALEKSRILVGVYHPDLFNNLTIKPILLSAYRQGRFLVGPNEAFVRAGSLATTYSSPSDVARDLAEMLEELRQGDLPAARASRHYSILLNEQVGRSLNLSMPNASDLKNQLDKLEHPDE